MTGRQVDLGLALLLGAIATGAWAWLNRRVRLRRRFGALLPRRPSGPAVLVRIGLRRLRWFYGCGWPRPRWLVVELWLLPVGLAIGYGARSPIPAVAAVLLIFPSCRWRERHGAIQEERSRAAAVIELCAALAGELRGGATPEQALETVTAPGRAAGSVLGRLGDEALARLAAGRYGADVPAALRWLGTLPGGAGACAIAACWQVTADSGTGLAAALDQVAEALRADGALHEEVRSELAGPRATAGLLAALPAFGLLLGAALGARPLSVLLHTPLGWGCLLAGLLLEVTGLLWTGRIVRAALADVGAPAGAVARPPGQRARPERPGTAAAPRRACRAGGGGPGGPHTRRPRAVPSARRRSSTTVRRRGCTGWPTHRGLPPVGEGVLGVSW
ncbi:type II secretion system F family protein [Kitasatospora sp. NBC_01302]|uniref:type II secretion system F family protein n=1 Tax=Kitasatospora sp. NBC_01302 TaxID=2903575 RepID=UPI002E0F6C39|nr:type II secretion system F family protein [Kitasatospora sp. NBC_01302]